MQRSCLRENRVLCASRAVSLPVQGQGVLSAPKHLCWCHVASHVRWRRAVGTRHAASAVTSAAALTTVACRGNTFAISSVWTSGSRSAHPSSTTIPTKQKRRSTGQGAKKPLDPQRPEKTWAPAGASGHELSRPKRVSWLPAYGMMSAMSIPVSCVGVKTHVFMDDLVVTP
jgi:hypothetical protein